MTERPILFSAPMVRAILDGRKTMTRRVVKWQGPKGFPHDFNKAFTDNPAGIKRLMVPYHHPDESYDEGCAHRHYPPQGDPGDRLWVRETWRIGAWNEHTGQLALDYCDGPRKEWITVPEIGCDSDVFERYWIQCTDECRALNLTPDPEGHYHWKPGESPLRWRPSIHMPRWASRITLEITAVRVERLQDISEQDAYAEGCFALGDCECTAVAQFRSLWESINGRGSWALNPWVWVVGFKRV